MVMDHFQPYFPPNPQPLPFVVQPVPDNRPVPDLGKLIQDFYRAVEAAKVVDELTGQPDCEDPEKMSLLERVRRLEEIVGVDTGEVVVSS